MNFITNLFSWWLIIFLLGSLSLPLTLSLFKNFWDKGYCFTKIISLGVLSYLIFVLGVIKILPFTRLSISILILFAVFLNFLYLFKFNNFAQFLKTIKQKYKIFLFQEFLFLLILAAWSFVRSFAPDIEGLEKFMDWGFINSMLRTKYFPPLDMWFSGQPINYYYFGHLIFAVLTKISNISSAITYNLSLATICSLTFISSFSLASNLTHFLQKKIKFSFILIAGLFSAFFLTFGGNLHPVYKITKMALTKNSITKAINSYWYPDATRFIGYDPETKDKTIHEFPLYSFVVADLHGHMNDIPIILFFVAFLLTFLASPSANFLNWKLIIPSGLTLSIAYMTNAWDFAVYGLFFAVFVFLLNFKNNPRTAFQKTLANGILTIIFWFIFSFPFSLNFIPMANGIKISDSHTPFYQLFILYGGFWLIILPFLRPTIYHLRSNTFALALIITATILILIPEIVYVKDIYIFEHRRANTMFKLVYQAFILYSLVSGYVLIYLTQTLKKPWSTLYKIIFFLIFSCHLVYPYFAIKSYYGSKKYQGLWGLNYLKISSPDNLAAVNWINQNIKGQPVMLEAAGDSYTTFNQISVATGLPTVEGWIVHEWLWRGGYDQPAARQTDVQKIYESEDIEEVKNLIQKYKIKYIFIGGKEYEKYLNINEVKFNNLGKIVFQSGKTKIYQIND